MARTRSQPWTRSPAPATPTSAAAKRRVFGVVGIDMIAGPSEVILADRNADPRFVAADLLAQAEHDEAAQSILITDDAMLARAVEAEVDRQLGDLPRAKIAGASWRDNGAVILCRLLSLALPLVDRLAPEHLEIMADDAEAVAGKTANAGAIFLGAFTPEAIGDYVGGSNDVLPTARSARFSSGLGVLDFMKAHVAAQVRSLFARDSRSAAVNVGEAEGSARTRVPSPCGFARTAHEPQAGQKPQSPRRGRPRRSDDPARSGRCRR